MTPTVFADLVCNLLTRHDTTPTSRRQRWSAMPCSTSRGALERCTAGLGVRVLVTFLTMLTSGFSVVECIWFAIAWTPKVR
jgi:hypothetical protein